MTTIKFHPDVLAAHAQFGGDLPSMQRCYEWHDLKKQIASIKDAALAVVDAKNDPYADFAGAIRRLELSLKEEQTP